MVQNDPTTDEFFRALYLLKQQNVFKSFDDTTQEQRRCSILATVRHNSVHGPVNRYAFSLVTWREIYYAKRPQGDLKS